MEAKDVFVAIYSDSKFTELTDNQRNTYIPIKTFESVDGRQFVEYQQIKGNNK